MHDTNATDTVFVAFIGLLLPFLAEEKVEALWGGFVAGSLFHHLYLLEQLLGLSKLY